MSEVEKSRILSLIEQRRAGRVDASYFVMALATSELTSDEINEILKSSFGGGEGERRG